jgi:hypothetical protein
VRTSLTIRVLSPNIPMLNLAVPQVPPLLFKVRMLVQELMLSTLYLLRCSSSMTMMMCISHTAIRILTATAKDILLRSALIKTKTK